MDDQNKPAWTVGEPAWEEHYGRFRELDRGSETVARIEVPSDVPGAFSVECDYSQEILRALNAPPFTREDVEQLRALASRAREVSMDAALTLSDDLVETLLEADRLIEAQDDLEYDSDVLRSIADRIEARLPPDDVGHG
ncbi:MAG: hypothetical protein V3T08_09440 [Gemmatimonadota bacterium]